MNLQKMLSRFQIFKQYKYSLLFNYPIHCNLIRLFCNKTNLNEIRALEELKERGLLRISGNESFQYMQGLITNDVKHLEEGSRSMYGMFLNNKGRVMYDAIFYKSTKEPSIFVECDKRAVQDLLKHLKMYKVRRKVEIEIMDGFKVYVLYNPNILNEEEIHFIELVSNVSQEKIVPCQVTSNISEINSDNYFLDLNKFNENTILSTDPRLPQLGIRIITTETYEELEKKLKNEGVPIESLNNTSHKSFRFKLGVGEGVEELPYGKCFPLEMNCDYLHGVSFHKGCYIGQEVTARTHHTGVVRKRLMPIYLDSRIPENTKAFTLDAPIQMDSENGQVVGKLRGACKNIALGLLRISEALKAPKLRIGNLTGSTIKPKWWPQEGSKESFTTSR